MKKTLYMETTNIEVERTVAEIQLLLGQCGCCEVMTIFDKQRQVSAVCFQIMFLEKMVPFRLPCRWEAIYGRLLKRRKNMMRKGAPEKLQEQAKRVAWRQILRWVQAQLALVDTDMVKVHEIFLPYVQTNISGETLFQKIENKGFQALEYTANAN